MSKKDTLYWGVYKNLEREVIELSRQIHFDDSQLLVYSLKIADLLIRANIEIEAISKELYFRNGGTIPVDNNNVERDLFFDTDCIELLEKKWSLSKKKVFVTASTFYFSNDENNILTPLKKANKRGTSGADWKQAYQAVKHDRARNLSKGNIKHLVRAMAALYLLNIYYREESFKLGSDINKIKFDKSLGSELFAIELKFVSFNLSTGEEGDFSQYDEYVYLEKYVDESYFNLVNRGKEYLKKQREALITSPEFINFIINNPDYIKGKKEFFTLCRDIGGEDFLRKISSIGNIELKSYGTSPKEAILNKGKKVYPAI